MADIRLESRLEAKLCYPDFLVILPYGLLSKQKHGKLISINVFRSYTIVVVLRSSRT